MHVPRCTATIDSFIVPEQVLWYTAAHYARRLVELCPLGPEEVRERAAQKSGVRRAADEAAMAEQATKAAASRAMSAGAHVPNDWCNSQNEPHFRWVSCAVTVLSCVERVRTSSISGKFFGSF